MPSPHLLLPPEAILRLLLKTDYELLTISATDAYQLYERIHQTAAQIAPVDAFYVALYLPEDEMLFFVYNEDSGVYDEPVTVAMGNGPTSTVIRERRPLVLTPQTVATQRGGIPFGDSQRTSQSAIHVPIFAGGASGSLILGVLSAQSYQTAVYGDSFLQVLEWLAVRVGVALSREKEQEMLEQLCGSEKVRHQENRRQMVALSARFVQMLVGITKAAESLRSLIPPHETKLHRATDVLCRTCYHRQTEANQLPLRITVDETNGIFSKLSGTNAPCNSDTSSEESRLSLLSEREHEVANYLAEGLSNPAIAERLAISINTVKHHVKAILQKLDVDNRTDVARVVTRSSQLASLP